MKDTIRFLAFLFCSISFFQQVQGQKILTVIRIDSTAERLKDTERVFVCTDDSLVAQIPGLKKLGITVFVGKKNVGWGVDVHVNNIEKRARKWGSNFITIDSYITTNKYDSLFVTLYVAPKEFLERHFENCEGKQLILVNASSKNEKVAEIDAYILEMPPQTFYRYSVEKDEVLLGLGKGYLTTTGNISFRKEDCRYFKLGGYGLDGGPPGVGIGLGVKSPELTELSRFTAEVYMALFSEL